MVTPKFIVFEGLDGSGTSTQANLLEQDWQRKGRMCLPTAEPSSGPVGQMIRQTFKGRLRFQEAEESFDRQMAYLFAADRYDHLYNDVDGILSMMAKGYSVISTRYYFSSFAYHCTDESHWKLVARLNEDFPEPDLLVYLRNPVIESIKRLDRRPIRDSYERAEKLEIVAGNYERVVSEYMGNKLIIDATRSQSDIHAEIVHHFETAL